MDKNKILAKHLCGANDAITEELYKHFNNSDTLESGKGNGSIVQKTPENDDLQLLNGAEGKSAIATGCGTHANADYSSTEGLATMTLDSGVYPG